MAEKFGSAQQASDAAEAQSGPTRMWHGVTDQTFGEASPSAPSSPSSKTPFRKNKRTRVTRACDDCRQRKIRCDGKRPCTHCKMYSYDCTDDQRSTRKRYPTSQHVGMLEKKFQRMETLLKAILPHVDVDDPKLDASELRRMLAVAQDRGHQVQMTQEMSASTPLDIQVDEDERNSLLETILEATGRLDMDDKRRWDYHGYSSGSAFLRRLAARFEGLVGLELNQDTFLRSRSISEVPWSLKDIALPSELADITVLPSRELAQDLVSNALDNACALMRFVHRPTFDRMFRRIYEIDPENHGNQDENFLALLYSVLALGCLFTSESTRLGPTVAKSEGVKYFISGRRMLDITDCRDLKSLQAVLFMIYFLHLSTRMSMCHSYISFAVASSFQMGLHRSVMTICDLIECETRKRVFWTIRNMEFYVCTLLGLPRTINDEDVDQELPLEVDDEYITEEGILPMPDGQVSMLAATNAHTKLLQILAKVMRHVYPVISMVRGISQKSGSYMVSYARVCEIERDLQEWIENLAWELKPDADVPGNFVRVQHLLRMAFAHVQMILYRPFLHHTSPCETEQPANTRSYHYGIACVKANRSIIQIMKDMEKQAILGGPYWFTIYSTFFSTISLVFHIWNNVNDHQALKSLSYAEYGRDVLAILARRSMSASECADTLSEPFNQLPERLRKARENEPSSRMKGWPPLAIPADKPAMSQNSERQSQPVQQATQQTWENRTARSHHSLASSAPASSADSNGDQNYGRSFSELYNQGYPFTRPTVGSATDSTTRQRQNLSPVDAMMVPYPNNFPISHQSMGIFGGRSGQESINQPQTGTDISEYNDIILANDLATDEDPQFDLEAQLPNPVPLYLTQWLPGHS